MFSRCEVHYNIETNIANGHASISMMDKKRNSLSFHFDVFFSSFHVCTIASCVSGFRLAPHFVSVRHQVKLQLFHLQKDHFTSGTQSWRRFIWRSWSRSFYFSNPKLTSFEEAGRDHFTSETHSWHHFAWWSWPRSFYFRNPKLTSFDETGRDHFTSATQSWRHFAWWNWSRSFYFRNPKLTSFCLKKLVEIILLQKPKVDVILFDETGRDHFTSAT